jgi:integrase
MVCPWLAHGLGCEALLGAPPDWSMRNATGSVRQRGTNSWELRIYQGVDPEDGKERWATKTVRGSRRFATAQLREFGQVARCGRIPAGTVAELLTQWTEAASPGWAATTRRETKSLVNRRLIPGLGHLAVAKLTTADIDDFYGHLLRRGGKDGRPLAPGTVQRAHVVLHRALAQAVRWDWIWVNPASQSSPPRPVPPEVRPPSPGVVTKLLSQVALCDRAFHLFLLLAATTGARRGELLALRWADVDLVTGTVSFQRSLVEGAGGPVLAPTKTRRSHRVALDEATADALDALHDDEISRGRGSIDHFVFAADPSGERPWLPNHATKLFIRYRNVAGLPRFRLHDLRHFMVTQMLDASVPVAVVAGRLAHARASTTLNVYAHVVPGGDRLAAEVLRSRLTSGSPSPKL